MDTYKGMNASIADMDRNGFLDVYVSNVHQALQAEGSLLWMFGRDPQTKEMIIKEQATQLGVLNPQRFGWGASLEDFDNDGWVDIIQANGMVDDSHDRLRADGEDCPDYWYVNEKVARSPPSYHRYASKWGDIRGMCIYGFEKNRVYLNPGKGQGKRYVDVADSVGLGEKTTSRGVAAADFDNDGRKDILITHMFKSPSLFRNVVAAEPAPAWIGFQLKSEFADCNSKGLGSVVELSYLDQGLRVRQKQEAQAATGFSAQSDSRISFGLGNYRGPVEVNVNWCGMHLQKYKLDSGSYHQLVGSNLGAN
jgi:hypothetical protein